MKKGLKSLSDSDPMPDISRFLEAVHLATNKLASTADTKTVLREVLEICVQAVGAAGGSIYIHDPASKTLRFLHVIPDEIEKRLERLDIPEDYGVAGEVFQSGKPMISEYGEQGDPHRRAIVRRTGVTVQNMLTMPLQIEGQKPIGVVQLVNKLHGTFDDTDTAVLDTISDVATLAILNSRLLERRAKISALEGMGRAAHDLANKAGVLVTFLPDFERNLHGLRKALDEAKVEGEPRFYLEMLEDTFQDVFAPYSDRVYRYARLVNDLAAGKPLVAKKKIGDLASVIQEAAYFMESTAKRNYVRLVYDLQRDAPEYAFDDLYVIRLVENIVGNAIKAVRETVPADWIRENGAVDDAFFGRVFLRYRYADGHHILQIEDEGPGLSPAQIRQLLSGQAVSKWEAASGTGLGSKVIVDLVTSHGAKLAIRSKLGEGALFEVDFPATEEQKHFAASTSFSKEKRG